MKPTNSFSHKQFTLIFKVNIKTLLDNLVKGWKHTCELIYEYHCGTGVLSLLFHYRVGQGVPLPHTVVEQESGFRDSEAPVV